MILAISGRIGSGKDTVGRIIQYLTCGADKANISYDTWDGNTVWNTRPHDWEIKKFAGKLKQIASILTGATLYQLEDQDFKKLDIGSDWGMTYRELLQKLGTEAMRNGLHTNVWVNALMADYHLRQKPPQITEKGAIFSFDAVYPNWIITDMRFPNEMDAVKARDGITIRVNRLYSTTGENGIPATFSQTQFHPSETALDDHEFDFVIDNNDSISDLIDKVKEILTLNNII